MSFRPALPHGSLEEVFPDVFFVTGTVRMPGPIPITFSRNMTVVRQGSSLTLIGSLRLSDEGLAQLDALGKVEHVVRVAAFHGVDDPFYKDRYGARVWAVEGSAYTKGFGGDAPASEGYFQPDVWMTRETELPIADAQLFVFESARPREGLVLLSREGGIVVSGDALQHWVAPDDYFNLPGRLLMRMMGFFKPHNVGPGWLRGAKPEVRELGKVLDLAFQHVLPVHGAAVIGDAREKYRPAIERLP